MDRGWYTRLTVVLVAVVAAWCALWPSLDPWMPDWAKSPDVVRAWFPGRISPGLDIKGGLRLVYEVEVEEAIAHRRDRAAERLLERLGRKFGIVPEDEAPTREQLEKVRERARVQRVDTRKIRVTFKDAKDAEVLDRDLLREWFPELKLLRSDGGVVELAIRSEELDRLRQTAVEQTARTISNRIDKLAIRETVVIARPQTSDIIVEIPGADEAMFDRIRSVISRTARLEFKVVDDLASTDIINKLGELPEGIERASEVVSAGEDNPRVVSTYLVARGEGARGRLQAYLETVEHLVPDDHELALGRGEFAEGEEEVWRTYYLERDTDVTGDHISDAFVTFDTRQGNQPVVAVHFDSEGARRFGEMTGRNVKKRMAIVLDGVVESAPVILTKIDGGRAQITLGSYRTYQELMREANDLVIVLRAGALPAPIRPVNEQLIGPTLGHDSVERGAMGAVVGVGLVLLFMFLYYQVAGVVADLMVVLNLLFLMALMAALEATLTLPGIAAVALTVGMAVDANVLITERIREELRLGRSPRAAVDQGFAKAFWSVFDSQITTFIAGVVLFQYGTGPIKGFAVMLMLGIVTSLFTGIFCSKVMFDWLVRGLRVQRLKVG